MDLSDPATPNGSIDMNCTTNRRKSGRIRQKPVLINKDPNIAQISSSGAKRKRADTVREQVEELSDDEESSPDESDPDEEELKERRRKANRSKRAPTKPVTKKPKAGPGFTTNLVVRPAVNGVKKTSKPKQPRARPVKNAGDDGTGLYAKVFSQSHTPDEVAADWIKEWEENNSEAMCDLVNLVIKCTGCNLQIDVHDVNDPDNAVSKLTDLQDEYQAQKITDYPLISRAKGNAAFRSTMTGFFETLIATCHASGLLYSDLAIIENIDVWVSTMSSSAIRPFRHTATVISLAIATALCKVANELTENTAKTTRQKEGEQKKKSVNKGRVKEFETKIAECDRKRAQVVESLKGIFDVVFVHRYRDVDPKIRVECIAALGTWLITLPDVFFEGMYLRYLGWVLSDTFPSSRAEVVKQLSRLFKNKDNVGRLRQFTERFRARLVEMSVQDSDVSIRAATVELLDMIRETGLLEPDDVDNIGRLIFDTEPRVRKAVAGFFAKNMDDYFETTLEDFGGEEGLAEILGEEVDDYDTPRMSWLKLKCVTEALQSYDAEDEGQDATPRDIDGGLVAAGHDSRYALAAQTICDGIAESRDWEVIAGYLLYDFSTADQAAEDPEAAFKARCKLTEKEEILLLEILNVAVKARLSETVEGEADKKGKKSRAQKEQSREVQETTAIHLAEVIPRLLKKFGSNPATATAVLRLEHVLNLEIFQELRQDSTTYASLLDDINKQFLTHGDQNVLAEASTALLHARGFEDLEEVTDSKLFELWDNSVHTLRLLATAGISQNISDSCNTVRRIAHLASISDCVKAFDQEGRAVQKSKQSKSSTESTRSLLLEVLRDPALDSEAGEEAEELLISAMKALLFYYMWAVRSLQEAIALKEPVATPPNRTAFSDALISLIETNHTTSQVRITAVGTYLDLYTLFATFRHIQSSPANADIAQNLVQHIPIDSQAPILSRYTALEKSFAKKARKALEAAPDDDLASDPEDSSDEEDDDEDDTHVQQETLLAEKRLCELTGKMVLAIVARVLDHEGSKQGKIKERLQRNKGRLGSNFKEVVAYLDEPKPKAKRKQPAKKAAAADISKSKPIVVEDEEGSSEEEEEPQYEEGGEEDLRARELLEDRIVDPDEESVGEGGGGDAGPGANEAEDEDDIMGD